MSSQAGRCLEHCLMNPLHIPAMHFAQQSFLCSFIKLALADAILHSQVDHSREQISLREGAYSPLHMDKLSSQNRLERVLKADWAGQMSSQRRIPDRWSKSHLSARLRSRLAYWWWRWDVSVCVITLGDLCWVFCQLVQGEDESRGQSSEVVWPPVFCLLSWMSGLWFIPTHSISFTAERARQWPRQAIGTHKSWERQNSRREWQRQTFSKLNDGSLHKTQ